MAVAIGSWTKAPEIAIVSSKNGSMESQTLLSLGHFGYEYLHAELGIMHPITWKGADDLEIQGLLHLPKHIASKKVPLIVSVHGGPTYANLNVSAGASMTTFLNFRGYAVFRPNPRGSAGRGQAFAEAVMGDMGGADAQDILSGIKAVCDRHPCIDAEKIGVIGGSYGGFMASLLPTLSPIFKASVSMAAVNDWHSFHTTTNIPSFDKLFLDEDPYSVKGGRYLARSPVMNAGKYKTPILHTAGMEDACVPQSQAVQSHKACLEKGVESAIVLYPGEGHGVRAFPAVIDLFVRSTAWFDKFVPL